MKNYWKSSEGLYCLWWSSCMRGSSIGQTEEAAHHPHGVRVGCSSLKSMNPASEPLLLSSLDSIGRLSFKTSNKDVLFFIFISMTKKLEKFEELIYGYYQNTFWAIFKLHHFSYCTMTTSVCMARSGSALAIDSNDTTSALYSIPVGSDHSESTINHVTLSKY